MTAPDTIGAVMLDFGGPTGPAELVPFLTELLTDVLPGPLWLKRAVAPSLARSRARKVEPNYRQIGWSPLVRTHRAQAAAVAEALGPDGPPLVSGMMFTAPTMSEAVAELVAKGVSRVVAVPLFPHYSIATTQAAFTFFHEALVRSGYDAGRVRWISSYAEHPLYIEALANTIRRGMADTPGPADEPVHLLFTAHGLPVSWVTRRGDPYPEHIRATIRAVVRALEWNGPYELGWQSRVGPVQWLTPSTPQVVDALAASGARRICLVPVSFASEHIETLHELDIELREHAHQKGIPHFGRAPALGTEPAFVACLTDLVRTGVRSLDRYECVRCALPKGDDHRARAKCPNCRFATPPFLRVPR